MEWKEKMRNRIITICVVSAIWGIALWVYNGYTSAASASPQYQIRLESTGNCKVYSEGKKVGEGNLFEGFSIDSLIKNDNR